MTNEEKDEFISEIARNPEIARIPPDDIYRRHVAREILKAIEPLIEAYATGCVEQAITDEWHAMIDRQRI